MYDIYEILENSCERASKELHDLNKKMSKEETTASKEDIQMLESLTHTIASTKKAMAMMDKYFEDGYSGNQQSWRRMSSAGRRGSSRSRGYARDTDMMQRLDNMYQNARDDREADMIQNIMNELSR